MRIVAVGRLSAGLTPPENPHFSPPLQSGLGKIGMCTSRLAEALGPTESLALLSTTPSCLLETVVVQDYRRKCRTSDARLAMLPALWEGHFGDSAEAAGDRRKACKPFSGPESLGKTRSAHPDPPKTALQGRRGVRVFGRSKPRREPYASEYSHGWALEIFGARVAHLGD